MNTHVVAPTSPIVEPNCLIEHSAIPTKSSAKAISFSRRIVSSSGLVGWGGSDTGLRPVLPVGSPNGEYHCHCAA